jgi:DNA-binding HxlR family transcriptional regulator
MEVTIGKTSSIAIPKKENEDYCDKNPTSSCPITDVIDRISDKWSVHAIIALGRSEKLRFNELMKKIHGVSQRMLTVTLRNLEEDGILTRTVYPEIPPRVEYQLTDLGRSLLAELVRLSNWATENMIQVFEARKRYGNRKV